MGSLVLRASDSRLKTALSLSLSLKLTLISLKSIVQDTLHINIWAVGILVVRASDSRPEGLGSNARCHQTPSEYTRSTCSLNQWVRSLVGFITNAGSGEYFPPLQFTCRNCGGGDRGRVAIYRPFGKFRRAKSYCHLYGALGQQQAYLLTMPR
ncbi:hypothetical protein TNCV_4309691 [Trichonephila clavipes]|nr:hypothetical protein TNCV_4309691 [Trichonephila clavipes]